MVGVETSVIELLPEGVERVAKSRKKKELDEVINEDPIVDSHVPDVVEEDDFVPDIQPMTVVEEVDDLNMNSEELRKEVIKARDNIETAYTQLCHYLHTVQRKEYWKSWGFISFKEYLAREIMFKKSKAFRLIQLWENLYIRQADKTILERMLKTIGWTKSVCLMFIINSENADEWIDKAQHLNVEDLEAEVKRYLKSLKPTDPEDSKEAVEKGEAIENSIESTRPQHIQFEFVDFQDYMAVMQAIDVMKQIEPSLSNSQSVANICRDFMGSNMPGEDRKASVVEWLIKYEKQFGLKIVVIDESEDQILHGFDYLKELSQNSASE